MVNEEQVRAFLGKKVHVTYSDVEGEAYNTGNVMSVDGTSLLITNSYGRSVIILLSKIIKLKELS